jgi:hypothetical protein
MVCCVIATVCTAIGVPTQYRAPFLSKPDVIGSILILTSCGLLAVAVLFATISSVLSRGRRGLVTLVAAVLLLVASVVLANMFPDYGLGNIH